MTIIPSAFPEILIIQPQKFEDGRGWFVESFRQDLLEAAVGHTLHFCQENVAQSSYGVIRGLHYQMPPSPQSKLVSVPYGKVIDVVVDIRKGSPNFGKHITIELSGENQNQLFIPRGFAHGYACLSEKCLLAYKVDSYYDKATEASIAFNDSQLDIDWKIPLEQQRLSPKDLEHPEFASAQYFDYKQSLYE